MTHKHTDIPSELLGVAHQLDALAKETPAGIEDRVYVASLPALRDGKAHRGGVLARIGPLEWLSPIAAAAAVAFLAWGLSVLLAPGVTPDGRADLIATVALDEHVIAALEYADLFAEAGWAEPLARDAEALEAHWQPMIDTVMLLDDEMGAG